MYRNPLFHKITVLALVFAITVCMSGCKNEKSDIGEAPSETVSKSEYRDCSTENTSEEPSAEYSAAESETSESTQATDTPAESSESPKSKIPKKPEENGNQPPATTEPMPATQTQTQEREENELPAVDPFVGSSEAATEPTPPATTEPMPTTQTQTQEREENELPGIDPFA